jgi:DNA-binding FadR family transcriptional regulator
MKRATAQNEVMSTEPRLYRIVSARIEELIREMNIRPGERLPAERDLATKLGVSRTSLREALIALELGGVVEVRGGSGVYVSEQATPASEGPAAGPGPFEVLAARRLIEVEVAGLAAKNATAANIDAILVAVEQMEQHHERSSDSEAADRNFHLAIARATGNSAMTGVIEYFQTEELRQQTLLDHRNILTAIASHDVAGAKAAMRNHLDRVTRTFSRG